MSHSGYIVVAARLQGLVGLGAEVGRGGAGIGVVAGEDWLEERAEDDLSTAG